MAILTKTEEKSKELKKRIEIFTKMHWVLFSTSIQYAIIKK